MIWVGTAKILAGFRLKDNHNPREFLAKQTGASKRAQGAQANAWEALCPFASAVIIAALSGVAAEKITWIAVTYTICRIIYGITYIADLATLRSVIWSVAVLLNIYIFVLALI